MSNRPNHRESEQEVLNEARNEPYGTIDVTPQIETALNTTIPVGYQASMPVSLTSSLVPEKYDYIALTYTGVDLTKVEYYTGGSGGTKVATLTLAYTSNILQTITRT